MTRRVVVECRFINGAFDFSPMEKYPYPEWKIVKEKYDPDTMSVTCILEREEST